MQRRNCLQREASKWAAVLFCCGVISGIPFLSFRLFWRCFSSFEAREGALMRLEAGLQAVGTAKSMYAYRVSYEVLARRTLADYQHKLKQQVRSDVYSKMPTSSEDVSEQFEKCVEATAGPVFTFGVERLQEASAQLAEVNCVHPVMIRLPCP
jgi:hypothetical protein